MKKTVIWTAAGIAAVGLSIPASAQMFTSPSGRPEIEQQEPTTSTSLVVPPAGLVGSVPSSVSLPNPPAQAVLATVPAITAPGGSVPAGSPQATQVPTTVDDHGGRCSEAEHANDPECAGVASGGAGGPTTSSAGPTSTTIGHHSGDDSSDDEDDDHGGRCSEAEHAGDPECAGSAASGTAPSTSVEPGDDGGHHRGHGGDDNSDDDNNSGPGGGDDDNDDNSGPGGGDDD